MTDIDENLRRQVWILGLFHSGTTIFWRSWRKDPRFLCFDEPFNVEIGLTFPGSGGKGTNDEYMLAFRDDPEHFWRLYAPMEPFQELDTSLTNRQENYICELINKAPNIVIDETRLHHHLSMIKKITPNSYVIHLHRRARGFVTSHLLPSRIRQNSIILNTKSRLGHIYRKYNFWSRYDLPAGMGRDKVIGHHAHSKFGILLSKAGYEAEKIMRAPAVVRLLAYWHYSYRLLEREGPMRFGDRFISLPYESFATNPKRVMSKLYERIGFEFPKNIVYADVHPPKLPFEQNDNRWFDAARLAGFSKNELDTLL